MKFNKLESGKTPSRAGVSKLGSRVITLLLLLLILLLAGCGKQEGTDDTGKQQPPPERKLTPEELVMKAEEEAMKQIPDFDHSDSLGGPDANNDGIRDDIEAYIESLELPPKQKKALRKTAKSLRKTLLVDLDNEDELLEATNSLMLAMECMFASFTEEEKDKEEKYWKILQAANANTEKRTQQQIDYNLKLSGRVFKALELEGDACHEE